MIAMPIYYINLAHRMDRRASVERQLNALGLSAQRIEAVTGGDVQRLVEADALPASSVQGLFPAEIACSMSHRLAWKAAVEADAAAALVLEDDAVISPAILPLLDTGIAARFDADLIKVETLLSPVRLGTRTRIWSEFVLREPFTSHYGAAGYVISRSAMEFALSNDFHHSMQVDVFLFGTPGPFLLRRGVLQVVPAPVVQASVLWGRDGSIGESDLTAFRRQRGRAATSPFRYVASRWPLVRAALARDILVLARRQIVPFLSAGSDAPLSEDSF